jgi:NAD/NADP transhydrogenase beta subunit
MPVLEAWQAGGRGGVHRTRARAGSSCIDNTLFYLDNPAMRFGDTKRMSEKIVWPI